MVTARCTVLVYHTIGKEQHPATNLTCKTHLMGYHKHRHAVEQIERLEDHAHKATKQRHIGITIAVETLEKML